MSGGFQSRLAPELEAFLLFKHALGRKYRRAEFTLRSFDRYVTTHAPQRGPLPFEELVRGWLARAEGRKPLTVAMELGPLREFFRYRRRTDPGSFVPGRDWAPPSTDPHFVPYVLTIAEVRLLRDATNGLRGPPFRAHTFRTLILILYCTGLRLGEAARLQDRDVDLTQRSFVVRESKGKTRYVPFGADLAGELAMYRRARSRVAGPGGTFLVTSDAQPYTIARVSKTLRRLLRRTGLKPPQGRVGPRPFDLRHTFAVHRLTRWYRSGADLHARLPWLSAYMGHDDLLGTETYLTTTPELLMAASRRFARRFRGSMR